MSNLKSTSEENRDSKKMNFIIIISDTLRRDHLSAYGNDWIHTENIQRFADKSLVFDRAYSASFPTVPMRRDVFTGAFTAAYTPWAPLTEIEPVLQQVLGNSYDYLSMMVTDETHILENGFHFDRGFDGFEWIRGQEGDRWKTSPRTTQFACNESKIRNPERLKRTHMRQRAHWRYERDTFPGRTSTRVCEWLEDNYKSTPFYLYVDFFDPHEPWDPPQWYVDMYDPDYDGQVIDYPKYTEWRKIMTERELKHTQALYAGEVTLLDRAVGKIFSKCEDLGLLENTMIILTTDHGFLLGEHGIIGKSLIGYKFRYCPLFEEINHIPLIIYHPDGIKGRTDALVQPPDFFPTITDIIDKPYLACNGTSFKDVLLGKKTSHREYAISAPYIRGQGIPATIIKDNWAAIFFSKISEKLASERVDKAVDGYKKIQAPWTDAKPVLFDLKKDPKQEQDVSHDHPELMAELKAQLVDYFDETGAEDDTLEFWQ
ncbi:MAG: sulfatase-like hydrolase/transferase [Candidatus Lokiarchaeota archaeon]|nr:sulfatase-like hydrolase/transferase [Candidatus Lokiarchaeota archaeon]